MFEPTIYRTRQNWLKNRNKESQILLKNTTDKFISLRKSFHFGLDVEAETITDDTHIWNNTSFYEYNQSLTIDESISRLFQNVQEGFAKDVSYWGFYDRLTAVGIHYCGKITFTD